MFAVYCESERAVLYTPYHPQSDGLVKRYNRTMLNMLATCTQDHPATWEDHLRGVCMAYNTSMHPTTGYSPFFLMFGRDARLPVDLTFKRITHASTDMQEISKNH